ncbi:MAG: filamentous hemagglutinin N-terminal domain-containing protein [Leptolyngbya sp. UWPOB_LEPTO1]|uniref:two-partner secretion domain-containing protein n=1 Tax=Leptolyngbya sp. UWPOB_LEPTO1 TaxID=2815653 RepID=UPI001AC712D1|nr:filamentous hemagglutinin N-terminal domain-containing protein [Leptolyngbya sp. UWPOB_LEPTO1]MBN8562898.1 filamentous hemagglutinin N-terminal domain-containing protein [Leptolyngbya sp. UWPOB_LEPTO1]
MATLTVTCPTTAQIISDGSTNTTVTPKGAIFEITGGTTVGSRNLFHSFAQFDVPTQSIASFLNDSSIVNIFARITGRKQSEIDGVLRSQGSANLFLINPNGILFSQNAQLEIGGSFVATTADALQFPGGATFSATASVPSQNPLLAVDPSAFLFSQATTGQIRNNANTLTGLVSPGGIPITGLRVPNGRSLLLVGGDILLNNGNLNALEGHLELGGLASSGTVGLSMNGETFRLQFPSDRLLANVTLDNRARVSVRGAKNGSLVVNANRLTANQGARFVAGTEGAGNGGIITLNANEIHLSGSGLEPIGSSFGTLTLSGIYNQVTNGASGNAGSIFIKTRQLNLTDGAIVLSNTLMNSLGDAGDIVIQAETLNASDEAIIASVSFGQGTGGAISVQTDKLNLTGGTSFITETFSADKDAGTITIVARDSVNISGTGTISGNSSALSSSTGAGGKAGNISMRTRSFRLADGALVNTRTTSSGEGGSITINTDTFEVSGGAQLTALTQGSGKAGNITINATGTARLIGFDPNFNERIIRFPGAVINSGNRSGLVSGQGGTIQVNASELFLVNGAGISASNFDQGNAGNILLNVQGDLTSTSQFATQGIVNGIFATRISNEMGRGGNIRITGRSINLTDSTQITARSQGLGEGGKITVEARTIALWRNSKITTDSNVGNGGNITLDADAIVALENSDILAFAPAGNGGRIEFKTRAFLSDPLYRSAPPTTNREALNALFTNGRVDVNASGVVFGTVTGVPDITFLQNDLTQLSQNSVDPNQLLANRCMVRDRQNTFYIIGAGGLPTNPGDISIYSTGTIQPVSPAASWQRGEPIIEPQGVYQLSNGDLILSRECS